MKLIVTIICTCALLAGCSEPIHSWELKKSTEFCKSKNSDIDYLIVYEAEYTKVVCLSGDLTRVGPSNQ